MTPRCIDNPPANLAGYNPLATAGDCVWDGVAAAHAVDFFPQCLRHTEGPKAGKPFILSPFQADYTATLFGWKRPDGTRRYREAFIALPRKNGKGLDKNTPLPTPAGWTTMGQVRVGDFLLDENGLPCQVTWVSDDRLLDCYEVEFTNGEVIVCDGDHLWTTKARIARPGGGKNTSRCPQVAVRNVRDIKATLTAGSRGDRNHSLPMPSPLQLADTVLPIDPYVLGAWLGDGHTDAAKITHSRLDKEITAGIRSAGLLVPECKDYGKGLALSYSIQEERKCGRGHSPERRNKNGRCLDCDKATEYARRHNLPLPESEPSTFHARLKSAGVLHNKHIPRCYLRASFSQRLALLQGLMDTDGTISKRGTDLSYDTTCVPLADGVCELLSTMGIKHTITERKMRCNGRDVSGKSYRIQFMAFKDELPVFTLARKLSRMKLSSSSARSKTVQFAAIRSVPSVVTRCIRVDSPSHQFLCGKTMLPTHNSHWMAGMILYLLGPMGEQSGQVYSAAFSRDQASLVFSPAAKMAMESPMLRKRMKVIESTKRIIYPMSGSFYRAIPAEAKQTHGFGASAVVFDELHTQTSRELYDVLRSSQGARKEPLFLSITTAGHDRHSICWELWTLARQVRDGVVKNPYFLPLIYELDDKDKWDDETTWHKCNPNLGVSISLDFLKEECQRAKDSPAYENTFRNLYLNQWTEQETRWLSMDRWRGCGGDLPDLSGRECWGGLDLSTTTDITALALAFPDGAGGCDLLMRFWVPSENARKRERRDQVPYRLWHDQGYLTFTEGDVVDYDVVRRDLNELREKYNIRELAIDRWNATQITTQLDGDGWQIHPHGQGYRDLSAASKEFEKMVIGGQLGHGDNPVLTWMANNVSLETDAAGNIKPSKAKSHEKIDGIVAAVMAVGRASAAEVSECWNPEDGVTL